MMTLIVGTNRPGSNTRKIAAQVEEIYAGLKVPLKVPEILKRLQAQAATFVDFVEKTKGVKIRP